MRMRRLHSGAHAVDLRVFGAQPRCQPIASGARGKAPPQGRPRQFRASGSHAIKSQAPRAADGDPVGQDLQVGFEQHGAAARRGCRRCPYGARPWPSDSWPRDRRQAPRLCIIDGNAGLHRAITLAWRSTKIQRCAVHKLRNILRKVPQHAHDDVVADFHLIVYASGLDTARAAAGVLREEVGEALPWRHREPQRGRRRAADLG